MHEVETRLEGIDEGAGAEKRNQWSGPKWRRICLFPS